MQTQEAVVPVQGLGDRCDRCGHRAFVITLHEAGVLLWCAHHFNTHEAPLAEYVISDLRDELR